MTKDNPVIITKAQAVKFVKDSRALYQLTCTLVQLVDAYEKAGNEEGIRWDVAFAQALKETGYFRYGGQVKSNQNNYCGMGATNDGAAGATFKTPYDGVLSQIQHLKAYGNELPLNRPMVPEYGRFKNVKRGWATYVEYLGRDDNPRNIYNATTKVWNPSIGWAVPGKGYGREIMDIVRRMAAVKV
jgi:hypothetical protein